MDRSTKRHARWTCSTLRLALGLLVPLILLGHPASALGAAPGLVLHASGPAPGPVLREILDPNLGLRWQLRIDVDHPDGPRRMVLVGGGFPVSVAPISVAPVAVAPVAILSTSASSNSPLPQPSVPASPPAPPSEALVIRAGDRITVAQDSAVIHARLQAVALESAVAGQRFRVRLGGGTIPDFSAPVISVVAQGAGQAQWPAGAVR